MKADVSHPVGYDPQWRQETLEARQSYFRDIFLVHPQVVECLKALKGLRETRIFTDKGVGMLIKGRPGGGKTTCIKYLRNRYPRRLFDGGSEVPFVDITVPRSATALNLAIAVLEALGDPVTARQKLTESLKRLSILLTKCKTEIIAVDNVQDIPEVRRERGLQHVGNTLREICDVGPVLMLFGTEEAAVVVSSNAQLKSRITSEWNISAFDVGTPTGLGSFLILVDKFERALPLPSYGNIAAQRCGVALAIASDGAIGYLARLLASATLSCIKRDGDSLTAADLEAAYFATFGDSARTVNPFAPNFVELRRLTRPGEPHFISTPTENGR